MTPTIIQRDHTFNTVSAATYLDLFPIIPYHSRNGNPTLPAPRHRSLHPPLLPTRYTLTELLPPPLDDTPEGLRARNHAAIAKVAALLPVNANKADLAAQCIAARAQAEDVLRLLRQHAGDIDPDAGSLKAARPATAPVAGVDWLGAENVSLDGINSHDVAFETMVSQPPWNRASEGSGARLLDRALQKARVEPSLARRDVPANDGERPGRAT